MTVVGRSNSFHYMSVFDTSGLKEGHLGVWMERAYFYECHCMPYYVLQHIFFFSYIISKSYILN